jgi:hypothetical protein
VGNPIIPPGGFAGFSQQVSAVKGMFARAGGVTRSRSTGRTTAKRARIRVALVGGKKRRKKRSGSLGAKVGRLVKGSAAAKLWGKKMRAKRKK